MKARYNIVDCCGGWVDTIEIDLPEYANPDSYRDDAMEASGWLVEVCESCNSATYEAIFAEWIK